MHFTLLYLYCTWHINLFILFLLSATIIQL